MRRADRRWRPATFLVTGTDPVTIGIGSTGSEPGEHTISRLTAIFNRWRDGARADVGEPTSALLFDLDGTLVDSEPMNHAAFRSYFAARGWDYLPEYDALFRGTRIHDVMARHSGPWDGHDFDEIFYGIISHYDPQANPPQLIAGAGETLARWASVIPVVIATSARASWAEQVLSKLHAPPGIELVSAECYRHSKPHPDAFLTAARTAGVAIDQCIIFEDSHAGLAAARASGASLVVGIQSSLSHEQLLAAGAHDSLTDLRPLAEIAAR